MLRFKRVLRWIFLGLFFLIGVEYHSAILLLWELFLAKKWNREKPTYISPQTYLATFSSSGNKILFKANLKSDAQQLRVPTLSYVKITALDSGKHVASGIILTKPASVSVPSLKMVLELYGQKNNGSINVTLQANGKYITGVPTTIKEIVKTDLYDNNEYKKYSTKDDSHIDYSELISKEESLRRGAAIQNLQTLLSF